MAPSGWAVYKEITIQDTNVDGNLTNFPFTVWFTNDADVDDYAAATGANIRFTTSPHGDANILPYDRIYYAEAAGSATGRFKVQVPSILATGGATIRMWYDNGAAADGTGDPYDANYLGVFHFNDASGNPADSSGNSNDFSGSNGSPTYQQTGAIYHGIEFDSNDYFTMTNGVSTFAKEPGAVEFWYDETQTVTSYGRFTSYANGEATGKYEFLRSNADQDLKFNYVKILFYV